MLFISNPLLLEREVKLEFDDSHNDFRKKCDKTRLVISGLFLYVLTSLFIIILNYPLSLTAIAFPIIVLIYTIAVLSDNRRRDLWPIIFITFSGFVLKLITITMFFIIYPLRNDENTPKIMDARKKPGLFGWIREEEKRLFFGIFFLIEFVLLIIACCLHWYFISFSHHSSTNTTITAMGRSRRNLRRSHRV
ncbi:Ras-related protein Rap-2c, putative [Brugia malayi]|uniref:Bm2310 n=1 Tax=Brugia malayi TaxID=6279 RepID=A0A1P6BU32_BRUMA|nr:Ras-related protein Rap-2c, putative [Brugia malayi]CDQ01098.1 Bm2310 [Brugia malayi]VIO99272.1 Ras-related protein Rap-2c, putative [Brugia malayi]